MTDPQDTTDPLLTTRQAAERLGKTYRQFTAYASHHKLPREGDPPRYRESVIREQAARLSPGRPSAPLVPMARPPDSADAEQRQIAATDMTALAQVISDLATRHEQALSGLHERLHAKDAELHNKDAELLRQAAEHRAEVDRLRAEYEARIEAERTKAEAAKGRASWWQRMTGRG